MIFYKIQKFGPQIMSRAPQPKKFVNKLYQIMNIPQYRQYISWDTYGTKIIILDTKGFQDHVIPKHFRLQKISSFFRQLHLHDFHKVKQASDCLVFQNYLFARDQQSKLGYIKRKRITKSQGLQKKVQTGQRSVSQQQLKQQKQIKAQKIQPIINNQQQNQYFPDQMIYWNPQRFSSMSSAKQMDILNSSFLEQLGQLNQDVSVQFRV